MEDTRTAVAMSGGVDSSVAAALLARRGAPLVGFSMKLVDRLGEGDRYGRCCSPEDFRDARQVADRLGFPHYVLDMEEDFRRHVLAPFATDYAAGRTPSPCVRCNTFIKFGALLARARAVGADRVATGHYAVLAPDPRTGRTLLRRAADPDKDQSYYLFDLSEVQRKAALFPLGGLRKDEVREVARAAGLSTAEKAESMDLCFVAEGGSYRDVLAPSGPGEIVDRDGAVLGRHAGIEHFTVGQRRGLGLAAERRLYVLKVEPEARRVVVGGGDALLSETCTLQGVRWIPFERAGGTLEAEVRIRSNHAGASARITDHGDGTATVRFDVPQRAIAPGQAAVAYDGDLVLGGGWIAARAPESALSRRRARGRVRRRDGSCP
jgi:tRNA-specific 2-thiouridylase